MCSILYIHASLAYQAYHNINLIPNGHCHRLGYIDEDTKWKTRLLRQIHTADPIGMGIKSCLYTILENCVLAKLSAHILTGLAVSTGTYVFGTISSSSILQCYLCTTYSCPKHRGVDPKILG